MHQAGKFIIRTMRVLIVSDTHGRLHPAILKLAERTDHVVHAGDIGGPGILDALAAGERQLTAVRGNNDQASRWPAAHKSMLESLPLTNSLELPGGELAVEHGDRINPAARRHEILRQRFPQARMIIYGHSHRLIIDREHTPQVINPGAAGRSRTYGGSSCIMLSISRGRWILRPYRFDLSSWDA
jgi:putative phosphoesterase